MRDFFEDYWQSMLGAAFVCLVVAGLWIAHKRPPREVVDRYTYITIEPRSYCSSYDSKGNCPSWSYYTEVVTHYMLRSADGATCETSWYTYVDIKQHAMHKCWQLFGWSGGTTDTQLAKASGGW